MNRLVISCLWSYYILSPVLFTNLFLPQSHILSPTALRDSIWNFKTSFNQWDEVNHHILETNKIRTLFIPCPSAVPY